MIQQRRLQNSFLTLIVESECYEILKLIENFFDFKELQIAVNTIVEIRLEIKYAEKSIDRCSSFFTHQFDQYSNYHTVAGEQWCNSITNLKDATIRASIFKNYHQAQEVVLETILMRPLRAIMAQHDLHYLHAAIMADTQDRCLIIAGPSRSGKTTTALSLLKDGYTMVTDDDCFLRREQGRVCYYPLATKIGLPSQLEAEVLMQYGRPQNERLANQFIYGNKRRLSNTVFKVHEQPNFYQCKAILFPEYKAEENFSTNLLSKHHAYEKIAQDSLPRYPLEVNGGAIVQNAFFTLFQLVQKTNAFRVVYNHSTIDQLKIFASQLLSDT